MNIRDSVGWQITILALICSAGLAYLFFSLLGGSDSRQSATTQAGESQASADANQRLADQPNGGSGFLAQADQLQPSPGGLRVGVSGGADAGQTYAEGEFGPDGRVVTIDNSGRYSFEDEIITMDSRAESDGRVTIPPSEEGGESISVPEDPLTYIRSQQNATSNNAFNNWSPATAGDSALSYIQSQQNATSNNAFNNWSPTNAGNSALDYIQSQSNATSNTAFQNWSPATAADQAADFIAEWLPGFNRNNFDTFNLNDPAVMGRMNENLEEVTAERQAEADAQLPTFSTGGYASCGALPTPPTDPSAGAEYADFSIAEFEALVAEEGKDNETAQCMGKAFVEGCARTSASIGGETLYMFSDGPTCRAGVSVSEYDRITLCRVSPSSNLVEELEELGIEIGEAEELLSETINRLNSAESALSAARSQLSFARDELADTESTDAEEIAALETNVRNLEVEVNTLENNVYDIREELAELEEQEAQTYALLFLLANFEGDCQFSRII